MFDPKHDRCDKETANMPRPEAIEALFILYRVTGDRSWQDKAWKMFQAIEQTTRTNIGYASLADVSSTTPNFIDGCESFWTGELKLHLYV
jgi:mannosyl-oligosaccharide alpha-1,2-mannosidase